MKMPKDNIDTVMFAPCGMNCLVCYKHCRHKKFMRWLFQQRCGQAGALPKMQHKGLYHGERAALLF